MKSQVYAICRVLSVVLLSSLLIVVPGKAAIDASSFAPAVSFDTNSGPTSVAIGDLDGDGQPDLSVVNHGAVGDYGTTVSVLRNTSNAGSLSFAPKVDLNTEIGPYNVAIGDIDGDDKPDLVVTNYAGGIGTTVSVFLNTSSEGTLSFADKVDFEVGDGPLGLAIGDIDGDGKLDLAIANFGAGLANTVSVLRNTSTVGSVSFDPSVDLTTDLGPYSIALGDIDGDGMLDLAVSCFKSGIGTTVSVFRNTSTSGTVSFASKVDLTTNQGPRSVALGDLDGDGQLDLAVTNAADGSGTTVSVFRNTSTIGSVSFASGVDVTTEAGPRGLAIGDLDRDGQPDLVIANFGEGSGNSVSVLRNTSTIGDISFEDKTEFTVGDGALDVGIGNLNGDAWLDVVVTNYGSGVGNTVSVLQKVPTLIVTKSSESEGGEPLLPGERLTYTITIANPLNVAATNVVVSDTFPAHTTFVADSVVIEPPSAGGVPGDAGTQPILASGILVDAQSEVIVTYVVTVDPSAEHMTVITNTVSITSDEMPLPISATIIDTVVTQPGISVTKEGPSTAVVGETVDYVFTVTNTGTRALTNVTVDDDVAGAGEYVSGDDGNDVLDLGESWIYSADYTIQPTDPQPLMNTVTVFAVDEFSTQVSDTDSHSLDIEFAPVLELVKEGPATANVGGTVEYTFRLSHAADSDGSPVGSIEVTDSIAGEATLVSGDDGDDLLEPGETWEYTVSYVVPASAPDPLLNTASATGEDRDGDTITADSNAHSLDVVYNPVLELVKEGPAAAGIGDTVEYTFRLSHAADSDGSPVGNLVVTDDVAGTATRIGGDDGDDLLELGETWVYIASYVVQADDPDPLLNTASATGEDGDGDTITADSNTHSLNLIYEAVLELVKEGPATAKVGDTVKYTFALSHAADSDGSPVGSIEVTDSIAGEATLVSGDDGDDLLEPGETWVYAASYVVKASDPDPLPNTASATGEDVDGGTVLASSNLHLLDVEFNPVLQVEGVWPAKLYVGETRVITYMVSHAASSDGSPVHDIAATSALVGPLTLVSGDDGDGLLELGEIWMYTASYFVDGLIPNPLAETITVTGLDRDFEAIPPCTGTYSAQVVARVFIPLILNSHTPDQR